ncbi:MAG: transporter substrate-binding domain-containing protein [Desulfobulbaceae bacterium]|nr:transporter substrate-binding domain-containing protein [Desulfobulbaceae bacterium]
MIRNRKSKKKFIGSRPLFRVVISCLIAACLFFPPLSSAVELTAAIFEIAPWGYRDDNGKVAGIEYEIISAIAKELGQPIDIQLLPYNRMIRHLETGAADFAIFYRSEKSEKAGEPLVKWGDLDIIVIGRSGTDIKTYDDLKALSIAVRLGGYFDPQFDSDTTLRKHMVDNYADGIRMLKSGRIDAIVGTAATLYWELQKQGLVSQDFGRPFFLSTAADWLHFSRKSANQDAKKKIVQTVETLIKRGEFARIFARYLPAEWHHH